MLIKFLLKIWPALLPITLYLLWIFFFEKLYRKYFAKKDFIEGEFKVIEKNAKVKRFSLDNKSFVITIYATLLLVIFSLIFTAINSKPGKYSVEEHKILVE